MTSNFISDVTDVIQVKVGFYTFQNFSNKTQITLNKQGFAINVT